MVVLGLAQALSLLQQPVPPAQRLLVVAGWLGATFVILRAVREAALMPRARGFFDALPVPPADKLRSDVVLALQSHSLLWAPVGWCIASSARPALAAVSLTELIALGLCVNLTLLRGARRSMWIAGLALALFAASNGTAGWVEPLRAACVACGAVALWRSYLPGAVPVRARPELRPFAGRIAIASGLVVPLLAHELRSNLIVRVGAIAATLAACLAVIGLRTGDVSQASVVVFVAAVAALALHSLPALCRNTLLTKLQFLAGSTGFARRMRWAVYGIPTALFVLALLASLPFDRSGTAMRDAAVFAGLYAAGAAGARVLPGITAWVMPFSCAITLIILSAML
jgi:hypothetical protein